MKRLLLILILTIIFQSLPVVNVVKADHGKSLRQTSHGFEIEGIYVGQNVLDYFDKKFIEEQKYYIFEKKDPQHKKMYFHIRIDKKNLIHLLKKQWPSHFLSIRLKDFHRYLKINYDVIEIAVWDPDYYGYTVDVGENIGIAGTKNGVYLDNNIIKSLRGSIYYKDNINECVERKKEISEYVAQSLASLPYPPYPRDEVLILTADKSRNSKIYQTIFYINEYHLMIRCIDWSKDMKYRDNLNIYFQTDGYKYWYDTKGWP